jgi:hypothetical protein
MDILFFLILGHLIGDYALQTDYMASHKKNSRAILTRHVVIYAASVWAMIAAYSFLYRPGLFIKLATIIFVAVLFIQHWLQDFIKNRYNNGSKQWYYIDQVLHLVILFAYRIFIFQ